MFSKLLMMKQLQYGTSTSTVYWERITVYLLTQNNTKYTDYVAVSSPFKLVNDQFTSVTSCCEYFCQKLTK